MINLNYFHNKKELSAYMWFENTTESFKIDSVKKKKQSKCNLNCNLKKICTLMLKPRSTLAYYELEVKEDPLKQLF